MKLRMAAVGVAALVVGGVTAGIASPAYAEGGTADLAITVDGTTIAQGAGGKFGRIETTNKGPDRATGLVFTYDISDLDTTRVVFEIDECGPPLDGLIECIISPDGIDKDGRITFFDPFEVVEDTPGPAGKITVSISHDGTDPVSSNNSMTADVAINEQGGVDLTVFAPDIAEEIVLASDSFEVAGDLLPGSETFAFVFVDNQGTVPTSGVRISLTLPDHVTFTAPEPDCTHAAGDTTTVCEYELVVLQPNVDDAFCYVANLGEGEIDDQSCFFAFFPVKVSDDAPESATLTGGVAEAWDMRLPILFSASTATDPEHDAGKAPEEMLPDVDPTDNVSFYSFFTSALDDSGTGGGDGDDDGKLPVTGSPVMLITGLGAVLLAGGTVLFLVTRRRRVRLTTDG